jgi:hypothetical protein
MAMITALLGSTTRAASEAAPIARRTANCRVERGPNRPAKTLRRFVRKGAAARAARPRGSMPPRRAIVGSNVDTSAPVMP